MPPTLPGYKIWEYLTPLTIAGSPVFSPWIDSTGFTTVYPFFFTAAGTLTVTMEGSTDAATLDTDFGSVTITSGTAVPLQAPFIRFKLVQTVADGTRTKVFMQARA